MGSRPFHQRTIGPSAAVAAALIIVGCSNTIITSAPLRDNGPDRPTAGGDELVVDAQQLDAPLVLDPLPAGLSVLESAYNPPDDGYPPSQATLYGDPTFTDTLDGPVLLVGSSSGSAVIGGPPGSAEDGRPVEFGLADGFLLKEGDRTWVSILQKARTTPSSWSPGECPRTSWCALPNGGLQHPDGDYCCRRGSAGAGAADRGQPAGRSLYLQRR